MNQCTEVMLNVQLVLSWPGAYGGQNGGACSGSIKWPALDSVVLLGTSVDVNSISLQVNAAAAAQASPPTDVLVVIHSFSWHALMMA